MRVFLGSSSESLPHLREIAMWLEQAGVEPVPWDDPGLFMPGDSTFHKLIEISNSVDGAVFVFAEDDQLWYRANAARQPRDNVLLEYGLFVGALGPKRAIICRRGAPRSATDLQGVNLIDMSTISRAQVQLNRWADELRRSSASGIPVPAADCTQQTATGYRATFRGRHLFIDFGMLQDLPAAAQSGSVVVLPANEFFDQRCFRDVRTAAGAFVQRHFPGEDELLQQSVLQKLAGSPVDRVETPGRPPLDSFRVGTCVYLERPLARPFGLILAAVATDRPPDGLRTDLSTIYQVIERVRCIVAEERISDVYIPLLGAGKGGVAPEIALITLISALLEARCRTGGHHLGEVHIVVYAPAASAPQIDPDRARDHLRRLVTLYQSAS